MDGQTPGGPGAQPESPPAATGAGGGPHGAQDTGQVPRPPGPSPQARTRRGTHVAGRASGAPRGRRCPRGPGPGGLRWPSPSAAEGGQSACQPGGEGPSPHQPHPTTRDPGHSPGALVTMVDCGRCSIASSHQERRTVPRQTPAWGRAGRASGKPCGPGFRGRDSAQGPGRGPRKAADFRALMARPPSQGSETCVHGRPPVGRAG